jgi:two-component system, chemotaxis family, chemotaxis protein CheY
MPVLIVEDNPTNGLILRHLVKKVYAGDIVVEADPVEALKLCHVQNFKLLLVDHMLPTMTGVQFVRLLRRIENYKETPAVMVTADTSRQLRDEALAAGVTEFLTKPVEALSFRRLMSELIPHELEAGSDAA